MLKYFLVCSLFTKGIFAALTGNCALDGVSAQQWLYWYDNEPVEDVEIEIFKTFKATNVTGVKVAPNGHYIKYVVVKYEQEEDGKVIVSPTEEFQKFEANEPYTPNTLINIELQFTCSEGTGTLVFYQPIKDTNNHEPYFGQSEYSCKLPMPLPADFNIGLLTNLNVFATDIDISNEKVIFSIDGDDFVLNYAEKDTLGKTHKAIIMTKKAVALSQKQSYVLTVQDLGTPPKIGTAVLIIDVDENTTFKPNPAFDKATYFGNYKVNKTLHSFSHEPIKLTKWIDGTKISVEGEYSGNFELTTNSNNETLISLKKYLEDSILTRQFVTTLVIKATHENSEGPGKATLVIYLPKITPEPVVLFDRPHYFIEVNAWIEDTGLAKLSAVAVPEEKISYSLDRFGECGALDHLELGETSGILKLNGKLTAGTYSCMAVATGVSSTKQDQAIITILVENYNNPFHPLSSVVVRHIKEDEEKIIELPCILEEPSECGYEILNQYPETEIGLFEVTEDHQIRSKGIDREMLAFTDLLIAQVTLRLKLIQVKKHSIAKRSVGGREWVNIPSDVPFTNEEFLLTVIIDDINDNRPIFSSNNLVVGYPVKQIAAFIALRNFIKVQATDADIGENAEIIYKIDNPYFNIDPTSGEIFARADLYNNLPTDILVTASNNERVGAIYSTMEIKVLALEDHHLVTLVVENLLSDDIDTTLALLSEKTGKTVVCLTWTVAFIKGADSEFFTNLIVYGIDESNPIENKILKKIIKAANLEKVMEVKDWEPQGAETKNIHFTQKYYLFETSSAYVGNIGALTATAAEVPEAIEYTLEDPLDENIRDKIVINSYSTNGTLTLTDKVAAGTYVFFVYATGEETRHVAQTTITLNVQQDGQTSFIITHIMENQETEINLPCESNHCNYEIIYQYPETTPGLFSIINGFTLRSGKIDREMSEIAFLAIPQFILQLKLNSNTRWKREIQEHEYVLVPKPFLISKNEITITVIIDDENDNPPVFVQRSPLLIGYPSKSLIKYVAPEFLTTVKATDKDVGENATIKYTSDSDYFTINSENGDIYPSEDLLDHLPIDFLITAKDQNGAGLPTTLQIKVQPVEAKHLISITIKNGMLDDVKGILELLSDKTKYLIRDMTAIVLPVGTYFYNVDAKHYAEVVVYGFSGDDLLTNDYLLSAILEANEDPNLTAVTWRAKCAGPQSNITFDQEYYLFEIGFSFTGPLPGVITASSIPEQPIEYSLKDVPDLKGKVIIDSKSGVITITNKIRVGTYVLSVNAEGTKTHEVAKTTVTITVPLDGYNNIITKHIDENAEDKIILPCETNDCDYAIISQTPETDNLLFTVDGYTLQYAKIDREMDELFHLPVPQFTLSLKQKPTRMKRDISEREWALIPNPVVVSRHEIIMIVIIDDVNDNHPVFNEKQPLLVGYPSSELLAFIAPPYLATIKATDKDAGVNSSIMYTSNSQYFQIHPRDGVIYPSDDALDHLPSNFTITATDRNGEGLETPFNVQVQPLNDRHLVYLEIQKVLLDEIEGVLKTLSDKTNYEIKHLIANILPIASGKSFVRDLNSGHYTEVVVYGFDSSNLVNNDVLIKAINDANVIPGLTAKKWESCSGNQEPTHSITFDKDYYLYKIDPSFIGLLEKITATCTPAEHITYSLEFKDESLKGKAQINVKTGELKIVDQVGTGNYVLVVKAKVLGTEIEAITPVTIYVDGQVDVLIKHVRENTANQEIILPCSTTTCQYTIISQYPDTNPYLFNVINGNVLVTNSLDREMTEIINQPVPQFSVRLKDSNTQRDKRQADKHDWALLPDTLTHNHNEIIVSIIVDDVNDNPPEFEAGPKLTVGYPSKHLLTYVNPQYLTIVQATDKDDGDNAKIYYSTMNEFYRVHPTSGIIYAAEDLGSLVFTVTATNRDADPTLSSDIEIEVKLLDDDHLVELTIGDVLWEDINSVLEEISKKSNVVVRSLTTSFTVPNTQKEQRSRNGKNASFQATLVVYALDLEGYQPVPKGRLARIFSDSEILDGSTIIPWDPSAQFCNNEEYDDTGYIAATIVLAVILLLALVALIAVVYYYKFYKVKKGSIFKKNILKNHSRLNDESEKSNSSDNIQRRQTGFIFNPPPVEEDEISIVGSDNSTSSGRKFDKLSEPALSDSRPAEALNIERRKSVTFNESVQKVNILVDTEESENDSKAPDFLVYRL